jgi:hypothetical protein
MVVRCPIGCICVKYDDGKHPSELSDYEDGACCDTCVHKQEPEPLQKGYHCKKCGFDQCEKCAKEKWEQDEIKAYFNN